MARVVVIGAGMGGMAAAARLRVKGHDVTLVEAADTHGGKLGTYRRDGFAFDTGPSLFTLPAVYRDLFLKTGGPLEDAVELVALDPGFHVRFADGTLLPMPGVGAGAAATAMGDVLGGRAGDDWRALLQRAGQMWAVTRRPFLESPLRGMGDLVPLARDLGAVRTVAPWQTLRRLGRATLSDWRAQQVLDRYATYAGSDPRRAPAVLATIPYVEATFGAWHIAGGLRSLGDALRARLDERGVEVRLGTPVARILLDAGRVSGVQLASGEPVPADVVVANADAAHVYGELLGPQAPREPRAARPAGPPRAAAPAGAGHAVAERLRAPARRRRAHARPGAQQRVVPPGLRPGVRRDLRPLAEARAGPHDLRVRPRRPRDAPRRPRGVVRAGERPAAQRERHRARHDRLGCPRP
ncbi:MAG: FAD-dependent oxidoreductase, partial [Candidatus Nanopelagicales bacterium]|nr:FAD-dependent oxidoreductase [Candidatus Nanopelagicales bacterium]